MAETDLIRRSEAIEIIENTDWYHQNASKDMVSGANPDEHQAWYKAEDVYKALESVPSAKPERMTNREDLIRQVNYVIFKLNDLRIIAYKLSRDIDDEMNDLGEIKSELEKYYDDKINKMNRYEHGK